MSKHFGIPEAAIAGDPSRAQPDHVDLSFLESEIEGATDMMEADNEDAPVKAPQAGRFYDIDEGDAHHCKVRDAVVEAFGVLDPKARTERCVLVAQRMKESAFQNEETGASYDVWRIGYSVEGSAPATIRPQLQHLTQRSKILLREQLEKHGLEIRDGGNGAGVQMLRSGNRMAIPAVHFDCLISRAS